MLYLTFLTWCLRGKSMEIPFVEPLWHAHPSIACYKDSSDDGILIKVHWEVKTQKQNWPLFRQFISNGRLCISLTTIHDNPQNLGEVFYYPANMTNTYFKMNFITNHHSFEKY